MEIEVKSKQSTFTGLMAKSFAWMALALLITAGVAIGGSLLLTSGVIPADTYLYILIGASVLQLILLFVIQGTGLLSKKQGSAILPFILYAVCTGFLISSVVAFTEATVLLYALGATVICFGSMALVGYFSKANMKVVYLIAMGLGIGALLLTFLNWIFGVNDTLYWIISYVFFAFILLITSYDVWQMKRLSESGYYDTNLAVFCAFQIYYDFIMIFLRVIQFFGRNRN